MRIDNSLNGKTVAHCEAFKEEQGNCFELGRFYCGFRIVFTDGTSLEIEESSQSGEIAAWIAAPDLKPISVEAMCDHGSSGGCTGSEVRVLSAGDSNIFCCRAHYRVEMQFRCDRNADLSLECRFPIPSWDSLKVHWKQPAKS